MSASDGALFACGLILFVFQLLLSFTGVAVAYVYRESNEHIKIRNPAMLAAFSVVRFFFSLWISTDTILAHAHTLTPLSVSCVV